MARMFLSYARSDLEAVKRLADDLEKQIGHEVWLDQAITGGHLWWDQVLANIRACDIFVYALTPESVESYACKQECRYAYQLGKTILPVVLGEGVKDHLLPSSLGEIQHVDYRDSTAQAAFALMKAINALPASRQLPDPLPEPPPVPLSPLGRVKEQIENPSKLERPEQIDLAFQLKELVQKGEDPDDVLDLLHRLKQREDVLFKVAHQIDAVVGEIQEQLTKAETQVPEGMVRIPKGPFLYGEGKEQVEIPYDFFIDIYPVTNQQYRAFIDAGGYDTEKFWSKEGWAWKAQEGIRQPEYWDDPKWNKSDHPVVGVSYYEAEAYAAWARKRLPTEQEWEKAARGTDGREYPWGNTFEKDRCNSTKSWWFFSDPETTPVTKNPNGVSPYGCYDMAGNVWEWCASWSDDSKEYRVIRGGAWGGAPGALRVSSRAGALPLRIPTIVIACSTSS